MPSQWSLPRTLLGTVAISRSYLRKGRATQIRVPIPSQENDIILDSSCCLSSKVGGGPQGGIRLESSRVTGQVNPTFWESMRA